MNSSRAADASSSPAETLSLVSSSEPVTVILNAHAGARGGDAARSEIEHAFARRGVAVRLVVPEPGGATEAVRASCADSTAPALIVAAGGDGTIAAVAAAIVGTKRVLGVLPMGTLNHFSKDLHIPQDLPAAVDAVVDGVVRAVDVGEVNGRVFINNSSLGVYPMLVASRDGHRRRFHHGRVRAFAEAVLHLFKRYPKLDLEIEVEGKSLRRRTPFLFVGNNPYQLAAFEIGTRETLSSGTLGIYLTPRIGRMDLLYLLARAFVGRLARKRDFESFRVESARIDLKELGMLVSMDGEVVRMDGPLEYGTRPGALNVVVPRESPPA